MIHARVRQEVRPRPIHRVSSKAHRHAYHIVIRVPSDPKSQASAPRPRLERVDGVALRKDDLKQRRFGVTIESVHYYRDPGESVYCAVLLKTYFELKTGDKLRTHQLLLVVAGNTHYEYMQQNTRLSL